MCSICDSKEPTRFINLYVFGSEGLNLCHTCEMQLVEFVRKMSSENLKDRIKKYEKNKKG